MEFIIAFIVFWIIFAILREVLISIRDTFLKLIDFIIKPFIMLKRALTIFSSVNNIKFIFVYLVALIIITSSIYSLVNYLFYYKGQEWAIEKQFFGLKNSLDVVLKIMRENRVSDEYIKNNISNIIDKSNFYVGIERIDGLSIKNNFELDKERNPVIKHYELLDGYYNLYCQANIRPPLYKQLYRAWTFSYFDYLKNPSSYRDNNLIWRSLPLIVSGAISFLLLSLFYISISAVKQKNNSQKIINIKELELRSKNAVLSLEKEKNNIEQELYRLRSASNKLYVAENDLRKKDEKIAEYKSIITEQNNKNAKIISLENDLVNKNKLLKDYEKKIENIEKNLNNKTLEQQLIDQHNVYSQIIKNEENPFQEYVYNLINKDNYFIKSRWKSFYEHDVSNSTNGSPQKTDIILASNNCIFVIEVKFTQNHVTCEGDYKNDEWLSISSDGRKKQIYSSGGKNPYKQVTGYVNSVLSRSKNAGFKRTPIIGIIVFPEGIKISNIGSEYQFGTKQINIFSYVAPINGLINLIAKLDSNFKQESDGKMNEHVSIFI